MKYPELRERFTQNLERIKQFINEPYSLQKAFYQAYARITYENFLTVMPEENELDFASEQALTQQLKNHFFEVMKLPSDTSTPFVPTEINRPLSLTILPKEEASSKTILIRDLIQLALHLHQRQKALSQNLDFCQLRENSEPDCRAKELLRKETELLGRIREISQSLSYEKGLKLSVGEQVALGRELRAKKKELSEQLPKLQEFTTKAKQVPLQDLQLRSALSFLIPTMKDDRDLLLEEILFILRSQILAEDGRRLIAVALLTQDDILTSKSWKMLTKGEKERIYAHSSWTQSIHYYMEKIEQAKALHGEQKDQLTLRAALQELAAAYLAGGIKGAATDDNFATEVAQIATQQFREYDFIIRAKDKSAQAQQKASENYLLVEALRKEKENQPLNELLNLIESICNRECVDQKLTRIHSLLSSQDKVLATYLEQRIKFPPQEVLIKGLKTAQQALKEALKNHTYSGTDDTTLTFADLSFYEVEPRLSKDLSEDEIIALLNAASISEAQLILDTNKNIELIIKKIKANDSLATLISFLLQINNLKKFSYFIERISNHEKFSGMYQPLIGHLDFILELLKDKKNAFIQAFAWCRLSKNLSEKALAIAVSKNHTLLQSCLVELNQFHEVVAGGQLQRIKDLYTPNIPSFVINKALIVALDKATSGTFINKYWDIVKFFCGLHEDNKPTAVNIRYAFTEALSHAPIDVVKYISELKTDNKPSSALISKGLEEAVSNRQVALVKCLCELKTENKPDRFSMGKALEAAAWERSLELVKYLCTFDIPNFSIKKALENAVWRNKKEIINYLEPLAKQAEAVSLNQNLFFADTKQAENQEDKTTTGLDLKILS